MPFQDASGEHPDEDRRWITYGIMRAIGNRVLNPSLARPET